MLVDKIVDFLAESWAGVTMADIAAEFPNVPAERLDEILVDLMIDDEATVTYFPGTLTVERYGVPRRGRPAPKAF